jgi:hypothetical protein
VLADWIQRKRRAGTRVELAGVDERVARGYVRRLTEAVSR